MPKKNMYKIIPEAILTAGNEKTVCPSPHPKGLNLFVL